MLRVASACLALGVLAALLTGCHSGGRVAYEPRLEMRCLHAGLPMPDNTFRLLDESRTQSRFPCPLAIAKLAPTSDEPDAALTTATMTPAEQAAWAEVFRGFNPIRHLMFLSPVNLRRDGADNVAALIAAAERIEAPLLLVHVVNRYGPNSAQVFGVLYDVQTGKPWATVGAKARFVDDDGDEVSLDNEHEDLRETDARYQATRSFETYALACLRERVGRDSPPVGTEEHDWYPIYPRYQIMPPPPVKGAAPTSQPAPTTQPAGAPRDEAKKPQELPPPVPNRPLRVATHQQNPTP